MLVKKFITAFLLPPGCLILLLILIALWQLRRRNWGAGTTIAACALLLWGFAVAPAADRLVARLEKGLSIPPHPSGDVIILLGGGLHDGVKDLTGTGTPHEEMFPRIVTAARLQKALRLPLIVSGGATAEYGDPEAPVVKRILVDLGVPPDRIVTEVKSRDTMENALYVSKLCSSQGYKRPILVTSAYHIRRSTAAFARHGIPVLPVPAQFQTVPGKSYHWVRLLPNAHQMHRSSTAIREYIGLLYYRLRAAVGR